nr:hypothetical protein [Tanacetum cinerariifolium]
SQKKFDDKGYWDSGCSRHMTGNMSYLSDFEPFDIGYVSFGQGGCKITGKGTIKTGNLSLRTCQNFKLLDDDNVLLRTPRQHNMYSIDLNNIVPHKDLTCLVAKASADECMLWHKRLGKQHKASCKSKLVNSVSKSLYTLHMDLFGPTSVSSISHKWYCLVVTDDFSRFTWTFFLKTKDETSGILRKFITKIENLKVKIIRTPAIGFLKPFGCHVMILNTLDNLGKFEAKGDEGYTKEEGIDYDEVFLPVARIKAIRLFLAYASFMGFIVYQMDVKSAFLYGTIDEEVTKWVLKNKKDERGIVIRNKARLVAQGYTKEEGIDYDEVFSPVARIEAIRLFLAYASFMGFIVYQMDVKSAFLYGTIDEEVGTIDQTLFIRREFEALMHDKFQMSAMGELNFFLGLQVLQKEDGIFLSQDKYVGDILKKFGYLDVRSINTPIDKENLWGKDGTRKYKEDGIFLSQDKYVGDILKKFGYLDVRSINTPIDKENIMFAVCAYARHQVTPKECHLHVVKRIFRYLKGHPKLGLWYPKESPFDLVAYSDSDYGGATQDRKSTTEGCQFLGRRLISWECKKQTIMATSTIKAEYIAVASYCGQVLWIQNQLLDYG